MHVDVKKFVSEENFTVDDYFGLIDMMSSYLTINAFAFGRIE